MMNPKALEALKQARELFRQPSEVAKDDIPEEVTQVFSEPIRRPQVHLIPTNAPKFTKETMKQEHKQESKAENGLASLAPKQTDKYVEMSVSKAVEACLAKGIKQPADIAKETGKKVQQVYTALWQVKQRKKKAKQQARAERLAKLPTPTQQAVQDDWDREGTPFEDAHMVVLRSRDWYEKEIDKLYDANGQLLLQIQELKTVIKYLEGKALKNV